MARRKSRAYERAQQAEREARARAEKVTDYERKQRKRERAKAPEGRFWTAERRQEFSKLVGQFNATITRLSDKYRGVVELPDYVSLAKEYQRIKNSKDYRIRCGQLARIFIKTRGDAQNIVKLADGRLILKYLKRELQYAQRAYNQDARKLREELYPNWEQMAPHERAGAEAASNIHEDTRPTDDLGADDLNDYWDARWDKAINYFNLYLSTWTAYHYGYEGYAEVVSIITAFMNDKPDALVTILEGPDPEKDINYIYLTVREARMAGADVSKVRKSSFSADFTPAETKRRNVLRFWKRKAAEYGVSH